MRGDGGARPRVTPAPVGSPPRAWGRSRVLGLAILRLRFTPTCVGTVSRRFLIKIRIPVHPHVRGDGAGVAGLAPADPGSPPRAWGRCVPGRRRRGGGRFTPTCVGTVRTCSGARACRQVHPHVRGDGGELSPRGGSSCGSPPRAWGRSGDDPGHGLQPRFTPTCVGTVMTAPAGRPWIAVHPHVRGDGLTLQEAGDVLDGSPPRAWGRSIASVASVEMSRFTPTCVGTVGFALRGSPRTAVHPHVRGDGFWGNRPAALGCGSPPRAWGRCRADGVRDDLFRFTPTCVGTVLALASLPPAATVHPHVRGDGG